MKSFGPLTVYLRFLGWKISYLEFYYKKSMEGNITVNQIYIRFTFELLLYSCIYIYLQNCSNSTNSAQLISLLQNIFLLLVWRKSPSTIFSSSSYLLVLASKVKINELRQPISHSSSTRQAMHDRNSLWCHSWGNTSVSSYAD